MLLIESLALKAGTKIIKTLRLFMQYIKGVE